MGRRHHLLSIMVIVVGTVLMDDKQEASNSPSTPSFYKSSFSPYYHEPLIGSKYQPAFNVYFPFDKNLAIYYPSSFNPFYQQFPFSFYQPDFAPYYYSSHQNNFGTSQINEAAFESDLHRTWSSIRRACPPARTLNPCSCFSKRVPFSVPVSTIICPAGTSSTTTQAIFTNIRAGFNINSVILTLPQGESSTNYIPSIFTLKYPTTTISVIYSTPTTTPAPTTTSTPPPPSCTISNVISPCSCVPTAEGSIGTITCPSGTTLAQIKSAFENIPANTNLGNVVLNIPGGTAVIPTNLLGTNAANTIQLIGPSLPLSELTIDSKAFTTSSGTCTLFSIQQFDVGVLDYSFLTGFKVLTDVSLVKCSNTPTLLNPPKGWPGNFPKPVLVLVDGIAYDSKCPAAALLEPCKCTIPKGDKVVTATCPEGSSMLEIMTAFTYFSGYGNIGNVIVHFPSATETIIPTRFLGNSFAQTIKIIGPSAKELSKLKINKLAFLTEKATEISIENFDLSNVDYGFLAGFQFLATIRINKCTNAPSKTQPPKNLPTADLPNLKSIFVDGTNIFTPALY